MPIDIEQLDSSTQALKKDWSFLEPFDLPIHSTKKRSAVFIRKLQQGDQKIEVYVKIYANIKQPFRSLFRRARSQNEARNLLFFQSLGIATPKILGWGLQRNSLGQNLRDFIVTEAVTGTQQLDQFVSKQCPDYKDTKNQSTRLFIARKLGEWTAMLHNEDFIHEDLKWRNILARPNDENPDLFFIDCPKGDFHCSSHRLSHKKLKDCAALDKIAHLQCSKTERRAFIASYLGGSATEQDINKMCSKIENLRQRRFDPKDEKQREHAKNNQKI